MYAPTFCEIYIIDLDLNYRKFLSIDDLVIIIIIGMHNIGLMFDIKYFVFFKNICGSCSISLFLVFFGKFNGKIQCLCFEEVGDRGVGRLVCRNRGFFDSIEIRRRGCCRGVS